MRKLKEILRLKYGVGLSHRQIGRSLAISPSVVSRYANRAAQLGIKQWPLPTGWDDTKLKHAFLQTQVKMKKHSLPDWATVHRELRNKCVTLQLLWEEYCERNPGGFYSYNHYCRMYREWLKTTSPSMRQVHKAGEKLFVDYCGPTVGVTDPETGEIRTAQVIVAVLGASSRQPGGCGLSWPGITVIKKDNVIVFQVVIWPVQLNPVNANPHHKEANFPAML